MIKYGCIEAAVVVTWSADLVGSTNGRGNHEELDGGSYNGAPQRQSNYASQARYTPSNSEGHILIILYQCQHVETGSLTPMAFIQIPWEFRRLSRLKSRIVLGWATFLALDFHHLWSSHSERVSQNLTKN